MINYATNQVHYDGNRFVDRYDIERKFPTRETSDKPAKGRRPATAATRDTAPVRDRRALARAHHRDGLPS